MFGRLRDSSTTAAVTGGGWLDGHNNGFGGISVGQNTDRGLGCWSLSDCHGDEQLVALASELCADDGRGLPESRFLEGLVLLLLWNFLGGGRLRHRSSRCRRQDPLSCTGPLAMGVRRMRWCHGRARGWCRRRCSLRSSFPGGSSRRAW
jgi:hypothetical protein